MACLLSYLLWFAVALAFLVSIIHAAMTAMAGG